MALFTKTIITDPDYVTYRDRVETIRYALCGLVLMTRLTVPEGKVHHPLLRGIERPREVRVIRLCGLTIYKRIKKAPGRPIPAKPPPESSSG